MSDEISEKLYRDDLIRAEQAAQELTNEELADLAGRDPSTVSAVRNGRPTVTLASLWFVSQALKLPWARMFEPRPENGPTIS
jgi:transcriptional regulator with XRE-family HTH domain